jgi:regulator of sigma E protease
MDLLKSAFYFIVVLSVLVIVHEWGHFIMARLCNMKVEDFSLFFGKRLFKLGERNGTEFNVRAVPLGGFVKIAGMEPEELSPPLYARRGESNHGPYKHLNGLYEEALNEVDFSQVSDRVSEAVVQAIGPDERLTERGREELQSLLLSTNINADEHRYIEAVLGAQSREPDPNGYNRKPLWQRALVIFAGPFMSLFFGYVLFCVMGFTTGLPEAADNAIETIIRNKPADKAGLKPGDRIVSIDGTKITDGDSMVRMIHDSPNRPLHLVVQRDGSQLNFTVTPASEEVSYPENGKTVKKSIGLLGFMPGMSWSTHNPVESVKRGSEIIYFQVTTTLQMVFSKQVKDNVGGIILIADQIHKDSKEGPRKVLLTGAMLSVSLGLINLFPIPILDGGQLMLLAWEGIRRRKLSSREVYAAQVVGLSIIGVLFVLVMYNDIMHLLMHKGLP